MSSSPFYYQQPFCERATGCRVREFGAPPDLSPFIAQLGLVFIRSHYVRQRVPDGCFALCIGVHEESRNVRAMVRPPVFDWAQFNVERGWTYVEARFRWGAGHQFLGYSPEDFGRSSWTLEEVMGRSWRRVGERIAETESLGERMQILIAALRKSCPSAHSLRPEFQRTAALLEGGNPNLRVDDLADAACLSSSQLRRLFGKYLGASPNEMLRLSRLWRSMQMALDNPDRGWGTIAAECGYSDQAHLVDEYRRFTGSAPRRWRANLAGVSALPVDGDLRLM